MSRVLLQTGGGNLGTGAGLTRFIPNFGGACTNLITAEANAQRTVRAAGSHTRLFVKVLSNASDGVTTITFRKNGANGNQSVSYAAPETGIKQDVTNSDSVVSGDLVNYQIVNAGAVGTITPALLHTVFSASTNTMNSYGLNGQTATTNFGVTTYFGLGNDGSNATLANVEARMGTPGTLKNMGVRVTANTLPAAATAVYTSQINGVNGTLTISFASGETGTKEDIVNSDAIVLNDLAAVKLVTTGGSGSISQVVSWVGFETTNRRTCYIGAQHSTRTVAQTRYFPMEGNNGATSVEANINHYISNLCTLSGMDVYVSANTWSSDTTCRTRINAANGNQVVVFATTVTGWLKDSTNSDVIASLTDLFAYQVVTSAGAGSITIETNVITAEMAAEGGGSTLLLMGCG